jgi:hypothetical protein
MPYCDFNLTASVIFLDALAADRPSSVISGSAGLAAGIIEENLPSGLFCPFSAVFAGPHFAKQIYRGISNPAHFAVRRTTATVCFVCGPTKQRHPVAPDRMAHLFCASVIAALFCCTRTPLQKQPFLPSR